MVQTVDAAIHQKLLLDAIVAATTEETAAIHQKVLLDAIILATSEETVSELIQMVKGDTRPTLEFIVKDENGTVINLTGATGIFRIRRRGAIGAALISRAVTITDAVNGKCQFAWLSTDWDSGKLDKAGDYDAELEITFSGSAIGTPFGLYKVVVRDQLG